MRKLLSAILLAAVCCGCLVSCSNELPKQYKFVKVLPGGTEEVEEMTASSDTAALKMYLDRMEKILVESLDQGKSQPYEMMFIISPDGDTLNTNEELLRAIVH